jgi:hypothetical protein
VVLKNYAALGMGTLHRLTVHVQFAAGHANVSGKRAQQR